MSGVRKVYPPPGLTPPTKSILHLLLIGMFIHYIQTLRYLHPLTALRKWFSPDDNSLGEYRLTVFRLGEPEGE